MYDIDKLREILEGVGHLKGSDIHEAFLSVAMVLARYDFTEEQENTILDLLSTEGRKEINKLPYSDEEAWENFNYGNVRIGDFVRVKPDAYDSEGGKKYNGLVGILLFMSNRVCTIRYLGLSPDKVVKHNIRYLDSLKRNVK